jgi:signal peptidase I
MAKHRPFTTLLWVAIIVVVVCVGGTAGIRYLIPLATYSVASSSGEPTLHKDEIVLVDSPRAFCQIKEPAPGQLVVHRKPTDRFKYIKRIVAGPGATVQMKAGRLFIDGQAVPTEPLGPDPAEAGSTLWRELLPDGKSYTVRDMGRTQFDDTSPVTLGPDQWFLLGDNRDNSADSRVPVEMGGIGVVQTEDLCGVIRSIFSSMDPKRAGIKL